jgi:hypothetical protein
MRYSAAFALALAAACTASAQQPIYESEVHGYFTAELHDPCTELDRKLAAGALKLSADSDRENLRQILRETGVSEASQVLVFSKTSLQKDRIAPWNPRAIYFNEEVYVGWVPGGIIELAGMDPGRGPVFYSFAAAGPPGLLHGLPRRRYDERCAGCLRALRLS